MFFVVYLEIKEHLFIYIQQIPWRICNHEHGGYREKYIYKKIIWRLDSTYRVTWRRTGGPAAAAVDLVEELIFLSLESSVMTGGQILSLSSCLILRPFVHCLLFYRTMEKSSKFQVLSLVLLRDSSKRARSKCRVQ